MTRRSLGALSALVALCALSPAEASQSGPKAVTSRIRQVTVYSDRARVSRHAAVAIAPRNRRYAFMKLPGWVDEASVRLALSPASVGRIVDVRVKREFLARATDASYRAAEAALHKTKAALATLTDEQTILDAEAKQIAAIKVFSAKKIAKDVLARSINVKTYGQVLSFISDSLRRVASRRRKIEAQAQALRPRLAAEQRRLTALRKLNRLEQTTVVVTVRGRSHANGRLKLTYMLPGATWEPVHELRVSGPTPRKVELLSYARVTQASGEDWSDVEISFSSQSSTEAIRIPELAALTLGDTKRTTRITRRRTSSFKRAQRAFRQQNKLWNEVNQKVRRFHFKQIYEDNFQSLSLIQSKTVQIFKALRRRGTTTHFKGLARASLRSDGHRARIRIARRSLAAKQRIVAAPERSLNAARTLRMINTSRRPLLPGKVALYHDSAFLGMTEVGFVAPGETFSLFLRVADQIKLSRTLDRKLSSIVRKKRTRLNVAYVVTVENLSSAKLSLDLADRIPVSENKAIRIDRVRISPRGTRPDGKGLLRWALTLAPKQKRSFRIQYRIEYPPSLILQMKRAERYRRRRKMKRRKRSISRDIMNLEQAL
jgi:uncharacterized protein (TIGR02231 family)